MVPPFCQWALFFWVRIESTLACACVTCHTETRSLFWGWGAGWGMGTGGPIFPLPKSFYPGSRSVSFRLFVFYRLQNITQRCVIFPHFFRFPLPWRSLFLYPLLILLLVHFPPPRCSPPPVTPPPPPPPIPRSLL